MSAVPKRVPSYMVARQSFGSTMFIGTAPQQSNGKVRDQHTTCSYTVCRWPQPCLVFPTPERHNLLASMNISQSHHCSSGSPLGTWIRSTTWSHLLLAHCLGHLENGLCKRCGTLKQNPYEGEESRTPTLNFELMRRLRHRVFCNARWQCRFRPSPSAGWRS